MWHNCIMRISTIISHRYLFEVGAIVQHYIQLRKIESQRDYVFAQDHGASKQQN